ncbi:hypothetical protein [Levilactobacillus parabrevis]|uniref:Uncharacterized protein n=1 Tax=Levilactobacillus parabrevis ATCC 53295 TaxID=1267003 RepID=A0A0R1GGT1_9LACO|nr:hypothetical protein [Levilactobacillus parabrevis]KRK33216.1 hypothetical protein FD07_GL002156 [Levilactobacillus parabrevis ATCC 53295]KRO04850.1 hypothetical protein IV61_GL001820 [Levilactobacillus parabrevis]
MKKTVIKELREALTRLGTSKDQATGKVTLALSISDKRHRAKTSFIRATSFDQAWKTVTETLAPAPQESWVRIETVNSLQRRPLVDLQQDLKVMTRMNFWRRGVSFDPELKTALLEMEINGHEFFHPGKDHQVGKNASDMWIDFKAIADYLQERDGQDVPDLAASQYIWSFTTTGIFTDGQQIWPLATREDGTTGVRLLQNPKQEIQSYLTAGEAYLARQIDDDGKFVYGYFPAMQRVLTNYNSVRHFSSIYALMEAIAATGNVADIEKARTALQWGIGPLSIK